MLNSPRANIDQPLQDIAHLFLDEWERSHGRTGRQACAALTRDMLTVTIDEALTAGELRLAKSESGREMVRRYMIQLVNEIYPQLAAIVERNLGCFVAASDVDVDSQAGQVCFHVHLRDVRRRAWGAETVHVCIGAAKTAMRVS